MSWFSKIREKILGRKPVTGGYNPPQFNRQSASIISGAPLFNLARADLMMGDPQVSFGLIVRNGALMSAEVNVTSSDDRIKAWVEYQWRRIWGTSATTLMKAKRYGWMPAEVLWRRERGDFEGFMGFESLSEVHPRDSRALTQGGRLVGAKFRRIESNEHSLFAPEVCWTTFDSEFGGEYGHALLERAHVPFHEKWMDKGWHRLMLVRMLKDAYTGDIYWGPLKEKVTLPDGQEIPVAQFLFESARNRLTGGVQIMDSSKDTNGNDKYKYEPPHDTGVPEAFFKWGEDLDKKIWKGQGVFPEVIEAAASGSGFSGRSVPLLMFVGSTQSEFNEILRCVDRDIIRPGAHINFGYDPDYEITPKPLTETLAEDISGTQVGGSAMGGGASTFSHVDPSGQATQFSESSDPTASDLIELGTAQSFARIQAKAREISALVKKNG